MDRNLDHREAFPPSGSPLSSHNRSMTPRPAAGHAAPGPLQGYAGKLAEV